MKRLRRIVVGIASLGVAVAVAWAYQSGNVANGGKITGSVIYKGKAPEPKPLEVTKDTAVCGKEKHFDESLLVGPGGGLQNAVVSLVGISQGKAFSPEKRVLRQKGCRYIPHVFLVPAGVEFDITNEDGVLHNIHTYSKKNPPVNRAQPKFKKVIQEKFTEPEIFEVRCDAHGWMGAWIVVQDHPYYAVTGPDGKFELADVPPGEYEIRVWHEKLGEQTQKVTVPAGGEASVQFSFAAG
ncbi:MAG: hypothetical protein KatS3mg076_0330 [Candidatus Binatia bacterium]|nr:MAG: hypothetical protein KatS3mg076_0330 [Candidatus Binatia bacterium]